MTVSGQAIPGWLRTSDQRIMSLSRDRLMTFGWTDGSTRARDFGRVGPLEMGAIGLDGGQNGGRPTVGRFSHDSMCWWRDYGRGEGGQSLRQRTTRNMVGEPSGADQS